METWNITQITNRDKARSINTVDKSRFLRDIQLDTSKGIIGHHLCQMSDNSSLNLVKFDFSISVLIKARNKKIASTIF